MILFPAIDLKDGKCVRLRQGEMQQATVFNTDPVAQAQSFEAQGFEWLHVVDLDGAFAGRPVNAAAVEAIVKTVNIPVQLGGGIRDLDTIVTWLEKGVVRVILGTAAVRNPKLVCKAAHELSGCIAVGIDARDGKVAVEGWAETSEMSALDLARRFEDAGVAAIIYTDIARDGVLDGLNSLPPLRSRGEHPGDRERRLCWLEDVRALPRLPGSKARSPGVHSMTAGSIPPRRSR